MPLLSVIIPTYNEAGNVKLLSKRLRAAFNGVDHEIIFVDDNSPDQTAEMIRSLPEFSKSIFLIQRPAKLGLSSAVDEGAKSAKGEWILVMDADLSHSPETAKSLFEKKEGNDLVVASRNISGSQKVRWPVSRDMISKGAEALCRPLVGNHTTDPLSGFFMIRREILQKTKVRVRGYKILLNILHDNPALNIADIPYSFGPRYSGKTKLDKGEIINYLFDLARIKFG
jgi:dolichol-phosphate mannosyltransferase